MPISSHPSLVYISWDGKLCAPDGIREPSTKYVRSDGRGFRRYYHSVIQWRAHIHFAWSKTGRHRQHEINERFLLQNETVFRLPNGGLDVNELQIQYELNRML